MLHLPHADPAAARSRVAHRPSWWSQHVASPLTAMYLHLDHADAESGDGAAAARGSRTGVPGLRPGS